MKEECGLSEIGRRARDAEAVDAAVVQSRVGVGAPVHPVERVVVAQRVVVGVVRLRPREGGRGPPGHDGTDDNAGCSI